MLGFHIVKRAGLPLWKRILLYVGAIFCALLLGALILLAIGVNPIKYYFQMFTLGTVGNKIAYKTFINYFKELVPLLLTSIALSLAFKMKFWNIGGEGQFIMGAISATFIALRFGGVLPQPITLVLMCLVAMLAAGLYGLLVAFLKVKFGTNETLMTLMLNYVALYLLYFIGETKAGWNIFLQEESERPVFKSFDVSFWSIPFGKFQLNICLVLTILIGVLVWLYLKKTKQGYEISVVGDSIGTARYAGMKVNKIILRTVFISAALIGLAAAFKVGTAGTLSTAITNDVGWTGIIVAWLAQLSIPVIIVVSALICLLQFGSVEAAATFGNVDSSFANMLQGLLLFLILAVDFFIRFKIVRNKTQVIATDGEALPATQENGAEEAVKEESNG